MNRTETKPVIREPVVPSDDQLILLMAWARPAIAIWVTAGVFGAMGCYQPRLTDAIAGADVSVARPLEFLLRAPPAVWFTIAVVATLAVLLKSRFGISGRAAVAFDWAVAGLAVAFGSVVGSMLGHAVLNLLLQKAG